MLTESLKLGTQLLVAETAVVGLSVCLSVTGVTTSVVGNIINT